MALRVPQIHEIAVKMISNGTIGLLAFIVAPTSQPSDEILVLNVCEGMTFGSLICRVVTIASTTVRCPGNKTLGQCQTHFVIPGFLHQKILSCCQGNGGP